MTPERYADIRRLIDWREPVRDSACGCAACNATRAIMDAMDEIDRLRAEVVRMKRESDLEQTRLDL